jgi:Flp pilus assembly protein TadD
MRAVRFQTRWQRPSWMMVSGEESHSWRWPPWRDLLGVAVIAAVLRALHLLAVRDDPLFQSVLGDSEVYVARARALLHGQVAEAHAFTPPLYPLFLAAVFAAAGEALELVRWLQAGLGAAAASATAAAAFLLWGRRTGWIAGLVMAASPVAIFFDGELLSASLVLALTSLGLAAVARALTGGGVPAMAAAGAALAAAALGQPHTGVLILGAIPAAWAAPPRGRRLLALGLAATVVLLAGAVVEWRASGHWVGISAGAGVNLYIGNHPGAEGGFDLPPDSGLKNSAFGLYPAARAVAAAAVGDSSLGPAAVSSYWTRRTWNWMRSEPETAARLLLKKLLLAVNSYEIPNHYSLEYFARESPVLALSPVRFAWLGPLGLAGFLALAMRRDRAAPWLAVSSGLYLAVLALFFVTSRYRLPLWPYLAVGAAAAIESLAAAWAAKAWRRTGAIAATTAALVLLSLLAPHPHFSPAHMQILLADILSKRGDAGGALRALTTAAAYHELPQAAQQLGNLHFRAGRYAEAAAAYRRALELDPKAGHTLYALAMAEIELGRPAEAAAALERAAAASPGDARVEQALAQARAVALGAPIEPGGVFDDSLRTRRQEKRAHFARGLAAARAGQRETARAAFMAVVALDPEDAEAHLNLGLLAELDGDLSGAEAELDAAASLGSADHPERLLALGRIAVKRGDLAAARGFYRRAAQVAPNDRRARNALAELEKASKR